MAPSLAPSSAPTSMPSVTPSACASDFGGRDRDYGSIHYWRNADVAGACEAYREAIDARSAQGETGPLASEFTDRKTVRNIPLISVYIVLVSFIKIR